MDTVETNEEGIELIKGFEGFSPSPYKCPSSLWTISYGAIYGLDGNRVDGNHRDITKEEGEQLLRRDLKRFERAVSRLVKVPLTINKFSALVSICFNIGSGNFQASTFRQKLNRGNYEGCANNFWQWRRGGGNRIILPGLVARREAEKVLFLK